MLKLFISTPPLNFNIYVTKHYRAYPKCSLQTGSILMTYKQQYWGFHCEIKNIYTYQPIRAYLSRIKTNRHDNKEKI